jgi:hypothetical protein
MTNDSFAGALMRTIGTMAGSIVTSSHISVRATTRDLIESNPQASLVLVFGCLTNQITA